jgi:glycosyltransferase involved in cell wall biosynthesis
VSEHSEYTKYLLHLVRLHQLEDRISILNRFVSDAEKVELLSGALAVYNGAEDEDNYAFVTAEAFLASRPVITHIDSGGVLMAVTDQKTGIVCEPKAEALAASIDMLYSDRSAARKYGENGLKWIAALDTSWDSVVSTLVGL